MGMVEANAQKQVQMAIQDTGTFELLLAKAQQTYSVLSEYRHRPKKNIIQVPIAPYIYRKYLVEYRA